MKRKKINRFIKSTNFDDILNSYDFKYLMCETPGCSRTVKVSPKAVSVKCYICTTMLVKDEKPKKRSSFPRGWKLYKQFVLEDGTVYEFGKENPKLKGKFEVTDIKKIKLEQKERQKHKKKLSKKEKEEIKEKKLLKHYKRKKIEVKKAKKEKSNKINNLI